MDMPRRVHLTHKRLGVETLRRTEAGVYEHFYKKGDNIKSYTGQTKDLGGSRPKQSLRERGKVASSEGYEYSHSRLKTLEGSGYDNLNDLERATLGANKGPGGRTYNKYHIPK